MLRNYDEIAHPNLQKLDADMNHNFENYTNNMYDTFYVGNKSAFPRNYMYSSILDSKLI